MKKCFIVVLVLPLLTFGQFSRKEVRNFQKGKLKEDTSFVYWLPYKKNTRELMVQGYYTTHSHKNLVAIDFKMKKGTTICAARSGIVMAIMESSNIGGLKDIGNHWNYIEIKHNDGSYALYGHLQQDGVTINEGDSVQQGQAIGLSGNTGYSAFPHLHFQVWNAAGEQIPVRFQTKKGARYIRQWRSYKAVHSN